MIKFIKNGNIFDSDATALVNAVNCLGVMGAGLAKQFAAKYPDMYIAYRQVCASKGLIPGEIHVYSFTDETTQKTRYILNFATKGSWKFPSRLEWIQNGLYNLKDIINSLKIDSVALPPVGCGLGGLKWPDVCQLITRILGSCDATITVYDPM